MTHTTHSLIRAGLIKTSLAFALTSSLLSYTGISHAQGNSMHADKARVVDYWTQDRINNAIPRDLVIDSRGLGYLRKADGSLEAYGHNQRPQLRSTNKQTPHAKPPGAGGGGSSSDSEAPNISTMIPLNGATTGYDQLFSALIYDDSGIKSVSFVITYPDGITTQSFTPVFAGEGTWETTLQGFSVGTWGWKVIAKDAAGKGGNTATTENSAFTVYAGGSTGGGSGGTSDHIETNAEWPRDPEEEVVGVEKAAGRIYFEMPANAKRKGPWAAYVCSGTVATDDAVERSIIITAAHCAYDDVNKAFARNVLFIPYQAATTGSGTDTDCGNDPLGCWVPSFGVVDVNWTTNTFPDNIEWDYAFYVVADNGAHADGYSTVPDELDIAAGSLPISFDQVQFDDSGTSSASSADFTHALGYSYSDDPNFMYCAENMTSKGSVNWWLDNCGLSGGSSGGPWVQPMNVTTNTGPIISINSWGYTGSPGMAGPILYNTSAACIFTRAKLADIENVSTTDGDAGVIKDCP